MNTRIFKYAVVALLTTACSVGLRAQATIGENKQPEPFSTLEVSTANLKGGLRLPQLTTYQRDELATESFKENPLAMGLMIFNTDTRCVETWNGEAWISLCSNDACHPPAPPVAFDQTLCNGKTASDLIASGSRIKWYDAATGGVQIEPGTVLTNRTYYCSQTDEYGCESARTAVEVAIEGDCSTAFDASVITTSEYCLPCGGDWTFTPEAAAVGQPVFRFYDAAAGGNLLATGSLPVTEAMLGISGAIQGSYTTVYVTVSDNAHQESPRKAIVLSGSKLPTFADYNLGADVDSLNKIAAAYGFGPAKAAMKYLADKIATEDQLKTDGRVFGGRFQWGREWVQTNEASHPIRLDGSFELYGSGERAVDMKGLGYSEANYEDGQVKTGDANYSHFFYNSDSDSQVQQRANWTIPDNSNLWGNGSPYYTVTAPNSGVKYKDKWYQSQVWNAAYGQRYNPCPSGWRVPTQDEWERIANYECNPMVRANSMTVSETGSVASESGGKAFVWLPVKCSAGKCTPALSTTWVSGDKTGYAIYRTNDWTTYAGWKEAHPEGDLLTFDKEPFLFLPAAGYRGPASSGVSFSGRAGYYWSSTLYGYGACTLLFNFGSNTVIVNNSNTRIHGFSVRCVQDED